MKLSQKLGGIYFLAHALLMNKNLERLASGKVNVPVSQLAPLVDVGAGVVCYF